MTDNPRPVRARHRLAFVRIVVVKPEWAAGPARPWPSVNSRRCTPTVATAHADRPNRADGRPLYVRGQRNMTVASVTRRPTMGPSRKRPRQHENLQPAGRL